MRTPGNDAGGCVSPISAASSSTPAAGSTSSLCGQTAKTAFASTTPSYSGFFEFDDAQAAVRVVLSNIVQVFIDVIGTLANIINIIVFSKIGFSDCATVALFGLAISDCGYLFLSGVSQVLDILDSTVGLRPFEPFKHFAFQVLWWNNMFYDITIFITVFNAVQKCACVAIPLIFKSIFTRFRACVIVILIYSALLIYYIPIFANPGTKTRFDYTRNWTRLGNYYHPNNAIVYDIFLMFSRILVPFISQVVVLFCTVILSVKLQASVDIRKAMTEGTVREFHESISNEMSKTKGKSKAKEIRAIQTVTLVSAIFVVCNLPDILITFTAKYVPEFNDAQKYENTYKMCGAIQDIFAVTNSAVNIIVYLKYNSKYRRKFTEIIGAFLHCRAKQIT